MRLESYRLYRYSLPLKRPLQFASAAIHNREGLIVELRADDGATGFGEIAPLPGISPEDLDSATTASVELLRQIKHRAALGPRDNARLRGRESMPPSLRFGIETALLAMVAHRNSDFVCNVLSPAPRTTVALNALLMGTAELVIEDACGYADEGYRAIKLKVGYLTPSDTVRLIEKLRHRIPEIVTIRLDANRGWEFNDAVVVASNVRDCGIEYIEEPLRDTRRLTELFEKTGLPYALDETLRATDRSVLLASDSAFDEEDPIADAAARARHKILRDACAWIVKPSLLGISPTEIALGLPLTSLSSKVVISSAFESSLGLVALANIAACVNEEDIPAGLDTHRWFQNNLLDAPLRIHNGTLDLEHANSLVSAFSPDGLELVANG